MEWEVGFAEEFQSWWDNLTLEGPLAIAKSVTKLKMRGPCLGGQMQTPFMAPVTPI